MTNSARVLTPGEYWFEDLHEVTKQDGTAVQEGETALLTRRQQLNEGRNV
jgi:hypothetical protein